MSNERQVLIYRHTLGKSSEPWIFAQATHFTRYQARLLGRELVDGFQPPLPATEFLGRNSSPFARAWHGVSARPTRALASLQTEGYRPTLIHAHFAFDAIYAARLASRLNVPLVVTLHGIDVSASNRTLLTSGKLAWWHLLVGRRELARSVAGFICVSDHVRKIASRYFPAERLHTQFLGIDLQKFAASPVPTNPTILHVGRFVEKKGTTYLLSALAQLRTSVPGVRLVIVGSGPLEGKLHDQIRSLGLGDSVEVISRATQTEIAALLTTARIFCLPSVTAANGDTEGLPISLIEAMATGRPVVSTLHAGIPEAVQDGREGLLVPERDPAALAKALQRLLLDHPLAQTMGRAARETVESRFDLRVCARRTEALYDTLLASTSTPS